MELRTIFQEAIRHSDSLVRLYNLLLTKNQRAIRPEWARRFRKAKLVNWSHGENLWRSKNDELLIIGKGNLSHQVFSPEALSVLLMSSLAMAMAAVDKILHETISYNFSHLGKNGQLDEFASIDLSKAYEIAYSARERRGRGGRKKSRPGHKLKEEVLQQIYMNSYLSARNLQRICSLKKKKNIFDRYSKVSTAHIAARELKRYWERIYHHRNCFAHECNIIRKAKAQKVRFYKLSHKQLIEEIEFVKNFGLFLSRDLQ
jgi:hypothetical protein